MPEGDKQNLDRLEFFSSEWWRAVTDAWNSSGDQSVLAKLGVVCFELDAPEVARVYVTWDEVGRARVVEQSADPAPAFSASAVNWQAFISGQFTALQSIMAGKIRFRGRLRAIAPYSRAFNRLAEVSRTVATRYDSTVM